MVLNNYSQQQTCERFLLNASPGAMLSMKKIVANGRLAKVALVRAPKEIQTKTAASCAMQMILIDQL